MASLTRCTHKSLFKHDQMAQLVSSNSFSFLILSLLKLPSVPAATLEYGLKGSCLFASLAPSLFAGTWVVMLLTANRFLPSLTSTTQVLANAHARSVALSS